MACIKEFKDSKSGLTAVCLNYPETEEELTSFSENFYNSMIKALESQYGPNWGTAVMKKVNQSKDTSI